MVEPIWPAPMTTTSFTILPPLAACQTRMTAASVDSYCIFDETPTNFRHFANINRHMDQLDQRLIDLLRENARAPAARLARALGVARTTLQSRLERLERPGVIPGYTVRPSEAHGRGPIPAYWLMTVPHKR